MTHTLAAEAKAKAVLRVLRGEDCGAVAEELGVSRRRLERWQKQFVEGGQASLHRPRRHRLPGGLRKRGKEIAQYGGLLVVLALVVLALVRFMDSGGG